MYVRLDVLQQLLKATADARAVVRRDVMMFLTSYVFLLRLPSECLPIQVVHKGVAIGAQAFVTVYQIGYNCTFVRGRTALGEYLDEEV